MDDLNLKRREANQGKKGAFSPGWRARFGGVFSLLAGKTSLHLLSHTSGRGTASGDLRPRASAAFRGRLPWMCAPPGEKSRLRNPR